MENDAQSGSGTPFSEYPAVLARLLSPETQANYYQAVLDFTKTLNDAAKAIFEGFSQFDSHAKATLVDELKRQRELRGEH